MEKEFKYFIALGLFTLAAMITGFWICKWVPAPYPPPKTIEDNKGITSGDPSGGDPEAVASPAHLTKTVNNNNTTCTTSPPQHVQSAPSSPPNQWIPTSNPKFCWDTFGQNITSWSFILKDQNMIAVPGCKTAGYPNKVSTATTTIVCTVNLTPNAYYYGYLSNLSSGVTYTDPHVYKTP